MRKLYILGLIALVATIIGLAWAEEVTITTYYPAPYGVYHELTTTSKTCLATNPLGTGFDEDPNSMVGIGTATPSRKLHIYGSSPYLRLQDTVDGVSAASFVEFYDSNSRQGYIGFGSTGTNDLYIKNEEGGNVIIENGNVGIGTAGPSHKLQITDAIRLSGGYGSLSPSGVWNGFVLGGTGSSPNAGSLFFGSNSGWKFHIGTKSTGTGAAFLPRVTFVDSGNVGIGTTSPASRLDLGGGCMTGSICSDCRMKRDITPLSQEGSFLAKVMKLQGASYEWKNLEDGRRYYGLIAQDVEKVIPEVVMTSNSNDNQKGLLSIGLDAVLVEAIKELNAENEALKARIEALEAKLR